MTAMPSQPPSDPTPDGPSGEGGHRLRRARRVVLDVLDRRERGEAVSDDSVLAAHPELLPELADELRAAAAVRDARVAAGKAAPILQPLSVLSEAELEAPIETSLGILLGPGEPTDPIPHSPPDHHALAVPGYGVFQEIGRGGQGGVFRAIQESTGKTVALKVLTGGLLAAPKHRARFEREARILAALRHPNIVSIIDRVRAADGSSCLVMEYIEGQDLDEYWKPLSRDADATRQVIELFHKLCLAVDEAHSRGIVHRDLKPSNVRVDARGEPHVLDFGLARAPNQAASRTVTTTGQIIGSLPWASPEQAAGESDDVDASADVYALGVMLYQALTGQFPYDVMGPIRTVLDNIAKAKPPAPSRVNRSRRAGRTLDAVVLKALAKRREDRYATAGDLARDLENVLELRRVSAPAVARRVAVMVPGLALILLGLGASLTFHLWTYPSRHVTVIPLPSVTNSLGMKFVRIWPGVFTMGDPPNPDPRFDGAVRHAMPIDHFFYLATTEVTQAQYQQVMGSNPSSAPSRGPDLPVQQVTQADAIEFCRRLSVTDGRRYRLPTEAEWEYACRAGSPTPFSGSGDLDEMGWYAGNSGGVLHPVGTKSPNQWGLYDMHGNVGEWCADTPQPVGSPRHKAVWHYSRGGSIQEAPERCRSGAWEGHAADVSRSDVGFRVLLEDPTPPLPGVTTHPATFSGPASPSQPRFPSH